MAQILSEEESSELKRNGIKYMAYTEAERIASTPVVQACFPGVSIRCGDCDESFSEHSFTTDMLPDSHPAHSIDPPKNISFIRTDFEAKQFLTLEVLKSTVVCKGCAFKLDELSGHWGPTWKAYEEYKRESNIGKKEEENSQGACAASESGSKVEDCKTRDVEGSEPHERV